MYPKIHLQIQQNYFWVFIYVGYTPKGGKSVPSYEMQLKYNFLNIDDESEALIGKSKP